VLAAALGHQRQFPLRLGANISGQADRQRLCAGGMRAMGISPSLQET